MSTMSIEGNRLRTLRTKSLLSSCALMVGFASLPAYAQDPASAPQPDVSQAAPVVDSADIVVTARKAKESAQKVPIIESVIGGERLQQLQVTQMNDLPTLVPGLTIGHFQAVGAQVSLRGIGATAFSNQIDQSVSLNIDGVQMGAGQAFKLGMFDLAQIEVLKGPQSLFYGKSTTAGVISLTTADPTNVLEMMGQVGYEAEARTWSGDGVISGPVTETLKLRLAAHYDHSDGYFYNGTTSILAGTGAVLPEYDRASHSSDVMIRGTALWDPASNFSARLKVSYADNLSVDNLATQFVNCPNGTGGVPPSYIPYIGGQNTCSLGRTTYVVGFDPAAFPGAAASGVPITHDGQPFSNSYLAVASLNLGYRPAAWLSLDSTTGYYHLAGNDWVNAYNTTYAGPPVIAQAALHREDFTEEVRATTSLTGPVDFLLGGFYESGSLASRSLILGNVDLKYPATLLYNLDTIDIKTYSAFGQVKYKIVPKLELDAGVRFTDETRTQDPVALPSGALYAEPVYRIHSGKFMPDVTLTYLPTDDLTLYGAYRQGFKSGSFGSQAVNVDNSFGDESAKGGEVGIKSRLLARQLILNIAGYRYDFNGLQVGVVAPPVNGYTVSRVVNAGSARTYGIDLDTAFRPRGVPGLQLNGAVNWNHARFIELNNVPCWSGQTISQGCNQNFNTVTGYYTAQDLSGTELPRAPNWQLTAGGSYEIKAGGDYAVVFNGSTNYSSQYRTQLANGLPDNGVYQRGYAKLDLGVTLKSPGDKWEAAFLTKNVTNKIIAGSCTVQAAQSGSAGMITGAATDGPSGTGQTVCFPEPGRELWFRLTWRPFSR